MSVLTKRSQRAALLAAIYCLSPLVGAQTSPVAPSPISQSSPAQAANGIGEPVDGWAIVRYSVLADGSTSNVRVIETVPPSVNAERIRQAVTAWTFEPATADGEAIDWHNGESVVAFGDDGLGEPSTAFDTAYDRIVSLTEQSLFSQANEALDRLLNEQATERVELGRTLAQMGTLSILRENPHRALRYLQLVTDQRITALPLEELFTALQIRLRIEIELGRVREALQTYEWIAAGLDPNAEDPFAPTAAQLKTTWETVEFLEVTGRIDDQPWRFDVRRQNY